MTSGAAPKAEGEARHEKNGLEALEGPPSLTRSAGHPRVLGTPESWALPTGPLISAQAG